MKLLFTLLILLGSLPVLAKKYVWPFAYYNSDAFWKKVVLDNRVQPLQLAAQDTAIVVVSNRKIQPDSVRWMTEERDGGRLRFFVVYARSGRWNARQMPDLASATAMIQQPNRDWVVYTEGMGKIFTTDLDRGFKMSSLYGVNVIMMDYPSIRSDLNSLRNYKFAKRNAIDAYGDFVPVLDSVKSLRERAALGKGHLTLFFHSMGNKVLRETVLNERLAEMNEAVWVDNLVLNAPCVSQRGHRKWLGQVRFAKRIYVHYNPEDGTLKWARIMSMHKQLGDRPRKPLLTGVSYINFNTLCGKGHSNFLKLGAPYVSPPEAIAHYNLLLHGGEWKPVPGNYAKTAYHGIGWDILPVVSEEPATALSGQR